MIIAKLIGGLGNQMFQYAMARRIAVKNNTILKLDIYNFKNNNKITYRKYGLNIFNIVENIASENEINFLKNKNNHIFDKINRKIRNIIIPYYKQSHVIEKQYNFDPKILKLNDNKYIEGYWQTEKYFKDIKDTIKNEFTFKIEPDLINKEIIKEIKECESVSLHIRRGDYISNLRINKKHGINSLEYYLKAIVLIKNKLKNPCIFVFSDDQDWAKDNLKIRNSIKFINHNRNSKSYEDLRLMSLCKHNIIANSSFSWWGAWLNQNRNKIVISPKKWFRAPRINTKDLIPKGWEKI